MGQKSIDIRPTTGVYSTYQRLSYEPWTAIAEFIDNSTQSFYDHKDKLLCKQDYKLRIEVEYVEDDDKGDYLVIRDNAYGMEFDDFCRAVTLDKPPINTKGRNEFGMGLKTAACWFGKWWSVESSQLGSDKKYYVEMDIASLTKDKNNMIDVLISQESYDQHYTKIVIKDLNKTMSARTKSKIKDALSNIYRMDLQDDMINMYVISKGERQSLEFKEPDVYEEKHSDGTITQWKKPIQFEICNDLGEQLNVSGFVAIREKGSPKKAGFTLMRRGRVIIGGVDNNYRPYELFGDSNSFVYQRLFGELHMDNWPAMQAKDNFDWHYHGDLEQKFIDKLAQLTKEYRTKAENIRVRAKTSISDVQQRVIDDISVPGFIDVRKIESAPMVIDDRRCLQEIETVVSKEQYEQSGTILDSADSMSMAINYQGTEYKFEIEYADNDMSQWMDVQKGEAYRIRINRNHEFFRPLVSNKDFIVVITKFVIAMVLSELEACKIASNGKIDSTAIRLNMNGILDIVAKGGVNE